MDNEKKEDTKELNTLSDLALESLENLTNEYQKDFDEHMKDADLVFKTEVETKEEMKNDQPPKKEKITVKIKKWWQNLDKKKKIITIVLALFIFLSLVGLIFFFTLKKDDLKEHKKPDVILEKDNYRYENGTLILLDSEDKEIVTYEC